jgi:uncharacterized protein YgiM (DUF1202 family)
MSWLKVPFLTLSLSTALYAAPEASATAAKAPPAQQVAKKAEQFKPFTGKVAANKVRLRIKPDVDSHIVRQFNKNDLLLIVGEEGEFYAVQPPKETKAYVFRSYILDNVVEANRVNVRLEPHVDAPIIAQLQAGTRLESHVCPMNHKWLEVAPPATTRFYVSKDFIAQAGGPEFLAQMEKRKQKVEELVQTAYATADAEFKKSYEEISLELLLSQFQTVARDYTDFPNSVAQAKEGIALVKQTYLQKKIDFLESKAQLSPVAKEELLAKHKEENRELFGGESTTSNSDLFAKRAQKKGSEGFWDTMEESLYLSWTAFHSGKKMDEFYAEQKANASVLTGTVEAYPNPVKNRPGDYILKGRDAPLGYLYSTAINLEKYVGKQVTLLAAPRPNNHFAFPAYFVLNVE